MKPRACKPPALERDAGPTAAVQQALPLENTAGAAIDRVVSRASSLLQASSLQRLWFCVWLPKLPLEAVSRASSLPQAVVEEQHGVHRVLMAGTEAQAAGVRPGLAANAALALLPALRLEERSLLGEQQTLEGLAAWLERFSSFVSIAGPAVLLLEIAGSLRLFGGLRALRKNIAEGLRGLGFDASLAIAPTPLAATWLARAGQRACIRDTANLAPVLRRLSLDCLDWPVSLREALTGMGVMTVGDCLRLPREGFTRRFGAAALLELDRALGHLPDPRPSWRAPERFCADYEMTEELTSRGLLLNICEELLLSHEQFLLARQLGTQRVRFSFFHYDGPATELRLGCARAERSATRWFELLQIRFEQLVLPAPVIAVRLQGGLAQPLQAETAELSLSRKAGMSQQRFSITQLAERLIARIGDQSVQSAYIVAEYRPQYAWCTRSLLSGVNSRASSLQQAGSLLRRPLWMLSEPAPLADDGTYPIHHGCRLQLVDGPERLETGWWDEDGIARDYYTAADPGGRQLWIFRNRTRAPSWYLHGYFG